MISSTAWCRNCSGAEFSDANTKARRCATISSCQGPRTDFFDRELVGAPTSGNALTSKSKVRCDIRIANSLFLEKFSLIRVRKFPVPLHREFGWKTLNSLADWASKSQAEGRISKIPC